MSPITAEFSPVFQKHVSFVIGRGGKTIKFINHKSGAHAEIRQPDAEHEHPWFYITGLPDQVSEAQRLIWEIRTEADSRENGNVSSYAPMPSMAVVAPEEPSTKSYEQEFPALERTLDSLSADEKSYLFWHGTGMSRHEVMAFDHFEKSSAETVFDESEEELRIADSRGAEEITIDGTCHKLDDAIWVPVPQYDTFGGVKCVGGYFNSRGVNLPYYYHLSEGAIDNPLARLEINHHNYAITGHHDLGIITPYNLQGEYGYPLPVYN